jgi:hypothetical protein
MPPQLTVGKYQPTKQPIPQAYGSTAPYAVTPPPPAYGGGVPDLSWMTKKPYGWSPSATYAGTEQPLAPPPSTTITAPSTEGTAFGGSPSADWSSMIGGSWEVAQAEALMAQQMEQARNAFQGDLRSAFIDMGYQGDTSKLGDFSKYIDKDTIQKAIDNKYSQYAQVEQQRSHADAINQALLASRGGTTSGLATTTATDLAGQVEQARYEGLRGFLQQGRAGLGNLTSLQGQLSQGVMQARFAAAQRLAQMYAASAQPTYGGGGGGGGEGPPPYQYGSYDYSQIPMDTFTGPYNPKNPWKIPITTGPYGPGSWPTQR